MLDVLRGGMIAIKFAIKTGNSGDIEVMQHLWGSLPDLSLSNIFR